MVRVRTPFFFPIFLLAFVVSSGLIFLACTTVNPAVATEFWIRDIPKRDLFRGIIMGITAITGIGLLTVSYLEYRVWKGWEPVWLRRMLTGVLVTDLYRDPKRAGFKWMEVEFRDGYRDTFSLDPSETSLFNLGDRLHLWVIGKHVTHGQILEEFATQPLPDGVRFLYRNRPESHSAAAWLLMCLSPIVAGLCFGHGMEHALFMEILIDRGTRRNSYVSHETGTFPLVYGCVLIIISLVILGVSAYYWKAGWDDSMFEGSGGPNEWRLRRFRGL